MVRTIANAAVAPFAAGARPVELPSGFAFVRVRGSENFVVVVVVQGVFFLQTGHPRYLAEIRSVVLARDRGGRGVPAVVLLQPAEGANGVSGFLEGRASVVRNKRKTANHATEKTKRVRTCHFRRIMNFLSLSVERMTVF